MPGIQAGTPTDRSGCSPTKADNESSGRHCQRLSTKNKTKKATLTQPPRIGPQQRARLTILCAAPLAKPIAAGGVTVEGQSQSRHIEGEHTRKKGTYCSLGGWPQLCRQTCYHNTERRCAFRSVGDEARIGQDECAYVLTESAEEEEGS